MHIVAIAWLYVTLMMSLTEKNITAGVLTFALYGLLPAGIILWLGGAGRRRRAAKRKLLAATAASGTNEDVNHPDRRDPGTDK